MVGRKSTCPAMQTHHQDPFTGRFLERKGRSPKKRAWGERLIFAALLVQSKAPLTGGEQSCLSRKQYSRGSNRCQAGGPSYVVRRPRCWPLGVMGWGWHQTKMVDPARAEGVW